MAGSKAMASNAQAVRLEVRLPTPRRRHVPEGMCKVQMSAVKGGVQASTNQSITKNRRTHDAASRETDGIH
jgi:hypothetical protein